MQNGPEIVTGLRGSLLRDSKTPLQASRPAWQQGHSKLPTATGNTEITRKERRVGSGERVIGEGIKGEARRESEQSQRPWSTEASEGLERMSEAWRGLNGRRQSDGGLAEGEEAEGASAEEAERRQRLCWKKTQEDPGGAQRAIWGWPG